MNAEVTKCQSKDGRSGRRILLKVRAKFGRVDTWQGAFRPRGEDEDSFIREEDIINNSRGVVNPSPYGFPKEEGSVSAPPLTVGNDGFLLPTFNFNVAAKCAADWDSNSQPKKSCSSSRRKKSRRWTVPWRRRPNLQNYELKTFSKIK